MRCCAEEVCDNQISTQLKQKKYPPSKSGSKGPYVGPHAGKLRKLSGAGFAGLRSGTANLDNLAFQSRGHEATKRMCNKLSMSIAYTPRDVPASTKMAHHFHDEPVSLLTTSEKTTSDHMDTGLFCSFLPDCTEFSSSMFLQKAGGQ